MYSEWYFVITTLFYFVFLTHFVPHSLNWQNSTRNILVILFTLKKIVSISCFLHWNPHTFSLLIVFMAYFVFFALLIASITTPKLPCPRVAPNSKISSTSLSSSNLIWLTGFLTEPVLPCVIVLKQSILDFRRLYMYKQDTTCYRLSTSILLDTTYYLRNE